LNRCSHTLRATARWPGDPFASRAPSGAGQSVRGHRPQECGRDRHSPNQQVLVSRLPATSRRLDRRVSSRAEDLGLSPSNMLRRISTKRSGRRTQRVCAPVRPVQGSVRSPCSVSAAPRSALFAKIFDDAHHSVPSSRGDHGSYLRNLRRRQIGGEFQESIEHARRGSQQGACLTRQDEAI